MILSDAQQQKLGKLFRELNEDNVYYKRFFLENGIDVREDPLKLLSIMPIMDKELIKRNYKDYVTDNKKEKLSFYLTSGTTGEPLRCVKSRSERNFAALETIKRRRVWDNEFRIDHFMELQGRITHTMDFCDFSQENMKSCFEYLMDQKPRWLCSSISVISKYARLVERGVLKYNPGSIQYIEFQGEFVDEHKRDYIEHVFGCKTIVHYGNRESWCIAYECPEKKLHVMDHIILEVNPISQFENAVGELLVTSLFNKVQPFIKYRTGDIGSLMYEKCNCGKTSYTVKLLGARTTTNIYGTEIIGDLFFKRVVHGVILGDHKAIDSFVVKQSQEKVIDVFIQKGFTYKESYTAMIGEKIKNGLGEGFFVNIQFVDSIPLENGRKLKLFSPYKPL